jgi:hypothetical protein
MIIWQGWGFLVAVIFFAVSVLVEKMVDTQTFNPFYYQQNGWPKLLASVISAVLVFLLSKYLAKKGKKAKSRHALFFIDIAKWPYILIGLGIILALFGTSRY